MAENNYMTRKEREVTMKKIEKGVFKGLPDLSDPKVYREFCRQYAEATTPGLEAVDEARRRSMEHMDIWVG